MPRPSLPPLLLAVAVTVGSSPHATAWPQFLSMIPNGRAVDFGVVNLGHAEGTILRHQFGRDFGVGRNWTTELCERDSDGDGQTNGQELGDPCCVWSIGFDELLAFTTNMTNPGNASSLADASKWTSLDCVAIQKDAAAKKAAGAPVGGSAAQATLAPAAAGSAATHVAAGGVASLAAVVTASALVVW